MASTIIAIGDELVAGHTLDTNSHWLAVRLRACGRPAKRITVVRDRQSEIVEQVHRDLADPDVEDVFCSGGLGPTPDDRTFEAVAAALDRELVTWQPVIERMEARVRTLRELGLLDTPDLGEGNRRMARVPAGPDRVFRNRRGTAPGLLYEVQGHRLFVLPGVPAEMRGIFLEEVEPEYLAGGIAPVILELRFTHAAESLFYPVMRALEESHPEVAVGSYPQTATRELILRFSGADEVRVREARDVVRLRAAGMGLAARSR
ncbi:MAG: molybdopterin-binding protein [Candidatus Dormibacteraeota bacterium]|nr:molybdopterin-binding protein [Candidatus Dormibacteraeota bacterium]